MLKIIFTFICLLVFLFNVNFVLAQETNLPPATEGQVIESRDRIVPLRFLPGHPLYLFITAKEAVTRVFQPSSAKRAEFDLVIASKRLKEAYLLQQDGKVSLANASLLRYSQRIEKLIDNVDKARSQNQETSPLVDQIVEMFKNHEVLLWAIESNEKSKVDADTFAKVVETFLSAIKSLNEINPGIKDRFKSASESAKLESTPASETEQIESPKRIYSPRRIIY